MQRVDRGGIGRIAQIDLEQGRVEAARTKSADRPRSAGHRDCAGFRRAGPRVSPTCCERWPTTAAVPDTSNCSAGVRVARANVGATGPYCARVGPGADLARVFDRDAGYAGGQPVDLQDAHAIAAADRRGGRVAVARSRRDAARATAAEMAVAFVVTLAFVDRVHVVPQTQDVSTRAVAETKLAKETADFRVGVLGGRIDAIAAGFVDLDGEIQIVAVARSSAARPLCPTLTGPNCLARPRVAACRAAPGRCAGSAGRRQWSYRCRSRSPPAHPARRAALALRPGRSSHAAAEAARIVGGGCRFDQSHVRKSRWFRKSPQGGRSRMIHCGASIH